MGGGDAWRFLGRVFPTAEAGENDLPIIPKFCPIATSHHDDIMLTLEVLEHPGWHGGAAASQHQRPRFDPDLQYCHCGICTFSQWLHGFYPGAVVSTFQRHADL